MKTKITFVALFITIISFAQQGINYKALIRDNAGNPVANQLIVVKFDILANANSTYQEQHNPTTDANGLIMLTIGKGTVINGDFNTIDWASDTHFLNVQINTGSGLTDMGTTEFLAVPYAKHAATATTATNVSGLEKISQNGKTGWRFIGKSPSIYGDIGNNAVDLSQSNSNSTTHGATGAFSTAMGISTTASGHSSTAMGALTIASGENSTAMGKSTVASGERSIAIGENTTASGDYSIAMGLSSIASADHSVAIGEKTKASKKNSTAMGLETKASGEYSTAMGRNTTALGHSSIAMGTQTKAIGNISTAMGAQSKASGSFSTAMNFSTEAKGLSSTAMGYATVASGEVATAMGRFTTASGESATSMGRSTTASGWASTAMGEGTVAQSRGSLAIGRYNYNGSAKKLFMIGNGTNNAISSRSNAFTVYPGTDASLAGLNSGFVMIGNNGENNLVFDTDEIMARNNGNASPLYLQRDGGNVFVGGAVVHSSDRRLKKDIAILPYGLKEVLQLQPKIYNWKDRTQTHKSLGLIAQEVQSIIKELVSQQDNEQKTLAVNYTELIPVLINAIKEQQTQIETLKSTINVQDTALVKQEESFQGLLSRLETLEKNQTIQTLTKNN